MEQKPTVGRIVHYQPDSGDKPWAAIVTEVCEGNNVGLMVCSPFNSLNGWPTHLEEGFPFSETPKPGHWSWPPR